jgi:exonuclease VII large subunit
MEQYFIYVGAGLGILSFILIIMDHFRLNSVIKKYRKLIRGLSEKNVEDLMVSYAEELDKIKQNMSNNIEKRLSTMEQKLPSCLRNTGMVTYNAFDNIGNNMSFSIAALDDNHDGLVITGIYSRENSYVYAKQIKNSQPVDKELSTEEKEALTKALTNA